MSTDRTPSDAAIEAIWLEARRAWQESPESALQIAQRLKIAYSTLQHRARRESWGERPPKARRRPSPKPPDEVVAAVVAATKAARTRAEIEEIALAAAREAEVERKKRLADRKPSARAEQILRGYHLIDYQLDNLEKLIMSADGRSPEDLERISRTLTGLVAKVESAGDAEGGRGKGRASPGNAAERNRNVERLRREIAERLERLNAEWLAQQKSE